ncbi:MAG: D-lyxose/D-mannose family sugar isomerase [Verrucomicrobiota bacterium]
MKRSQINLAIRQASAFFKANGWRLPPNPAWDVTDFGLGDYSRKGLLLINLAEEPEYCEKLMYARMGQMTPTHAHKLKKEDIICRAGQLAIQLWNGHPDSTGESIFQIQVNRERRSIQSGSALILQAGERVTIPPGVFHAFWPTSEECIMGEVSTANNDQTDNYFVDPNIGRFPEIEEDEEVGVRILSEDT